MSSSEDRNTNDSSNMCEKCISILDPRAPVHTDGLRRMGSYGDSNYNAFIPDISSPNNSLMDSYPAD